MELSPAVIKYDASLENSSSEGFTWESHLGEDPSMESLVPGLQLPLLVKARAKNCPQSQCSISNLCTVSCTVNSTLVRNYKDTIFGFYMALLLMWSYKFDKSSCSQWIPHSQVPFYCFRVCYPRVYCKGAMCTLSPLNIGAGAYKLPFCCSCLGNVPSNTHIWYSYIIFWLPIRMPICSDGVMPTHELVRQLH